MVKSYNKNEQTHLTAFLYVNQVTRLQIGQKYTSSIVSTIIITMRLFTTYQFPPVLAKTSHEESYKQVRQQDAYLAIRPAYPRGCCPRTAKGDKTYLQPVFLHR